MDSINNSEEPKKRDTKKIAVIGISAAAVVAVGALAFVMMNKRDPKTVVIDAFKSVCSQEMVTPMDDIFGYEELQNTIWKENTSIDVEVKLDDSSDANIKEMAGSGIEIHTKQDKKNKKSSFSIGADYNGMDLISADMYVDESKVMMAIPDLSGKVFLLNYADDLEGQLKNSPVMGPIVEESGIEINALVEYFQYVNQVYGQEKGGIVDAEALWNRYKEGSMAVEDLKTAMTVEKGEKSVFTVDGKEVDCNGYQVVITKDALMQFLKVSSQFFMKDEDLKKETLEYITQIVRLTESLEGGSDYEGQTPDEVMAETWTSMETSVDEMIQELEASLGDISMTVYVDKKGRLSALDAATTVTSTEGSVSDVKLHTELKGGSYLMENMDLVLTITADGEDSIATFTKIGSYDKKTLTSDMKLDLKSNDYEFNIGYHGNFNVENGDYEISLLFDDSEEEQFTLTSKGIVSNIVKGKSFDIALDRTSLEIGDGEMIGFSGSYSLKPLDTEISVVPGEELDILAATQEDWEAVITQMYSGLFGLLMKMQ